MIVPSIDLMGGKAVQLEQGRRLVIERDDVRDLARRFAVCGEVAIVDLDAALGRGDNVALIRELCREVRAYVGGGIRDRESALGYLRAGATGVIIGTAADEDWVRRLPRSAVIVAVDGSAEGIRVHGWRDAVQETPLQRVRRLARHCAGFLYTAVEREGIFGGADIETAAALRCAFDGRLIVAGGIGSVEEVTRLDRLGADAQVGMALYTGRFDIADAVIDAIDFERSGGLVPTVVCDAADGQVRMLAYSSRESLRYAIEQRCGAFFSRKRARIWVKGESSGNLQTLERIETDCDRDALCFYVRQRGPTCHTSSDRCFGDARFGWPQLASRVAERVGAPADASFTARLLRSPGLLSAKLREEAAELAEADTRDAAAWEAADLLYFMTVKMQAAGVSIEDVMAQLRSRAS